MRAAAASGAVSPRGGVHAPSGESGPSVTGRLTAAAAAALAVLVLAAPARAASGPQLAGLQVALRAYGLYSGPIDGVAGPATAAAVKALQQRAGLPVDGVAGTRTRAALGLLGGPLFGSRELLRGRIGWDVSVLQFLLHRRGLYAGPLDGVFGARTERALRRFQRAAGLTVDGVAGKATAAALVRSGPAGVGPATARYVVREGDTLTALAGRFHTTIAALARLNGLDPDGVIEIGARLKVPAAVRAPAATPASAPATEGAQAIRDAVSTWSTRYGVDPSLALALAWMESGFQADVRSPVGAWGPMQLLPSTWDYVEQSLLGQKVPHTAAGNVQVGVAYLRHLLARFGGDERLALAAWYQGELAVRRDGVYAETKLFVDDVLALKQRM